MPLSPEFERLSREIHPAERTVPQPSSADWLEGFVRSALWSAGPGLIGVSAPRDIQRWREDNIAGDLASQVGGFLVPYAGWMRATRIPSIARRLDRIGDATTAPVSTAVRRELARWSPLEAGRIGGAAIAGGDIGQVALEAGINLGIVGAGSAGLAALSGAGRRARRPESVFSGVDLRAPLQLQVRQMRQKVAAGEVPEGALAQAQREITEFERAIRLETPQMATAREHTGERLRQLRAVSRLEGEDKNVQQINRLFTTGRTKNMVKRKLAESFREGFESSADWQRVVRRFGLPDNWTQLVQYPRHIAFGTGKGAQASARNVKKQVEGNLSPIGGGWYLGREADDGLFVMARRLGGDKPSRADEWMVFKTDRPGDFATGAGRWANAVTKRVAWLSDRADLPAMTGARIWDTLLSMQDQIPLVSRADLRRSGPAAVAATVSRWIGADKLADHASARQVQDFVRAYVAPTQFQFGDNPRAHHIHALAKLTFSLADRQAEQILHGVAAVGPHRNIWSAILRGPESRSGLLKHIDDLTPEDMWQLQSVWSRQVPHADLGREALSPRVRAFLEDLHKADQAFIQDAARVQQAAGRSDFTPAEGHYGISRLWRGDYRARVYDESGNVVFMGSGHQAKQALDEARFVVERARGEGRQWRHDSEVFLADRTVDLELATKLPIATHDFSMAQAFRQERLREVLRPRAFEERTGVGGYMGEAAPWSKKELRDLLTGGVIARQKYLADTSVKSLLSGDLAKLAKEDPRISRLVTQRLDDMAGRPGPIAQFTNRAVDSLLAPVLGKNSATKIVHAANQVMYDWTLGMGNVAFVAINTLQFMQTGLSHLSYVTSAPVDRLARSYSWLPAVGSDGLVKGGFGTLDTMKVVGKVFREMGNPSAATRAGYNRAVAEGVVDPRYVESTLGENSRMILDFRRALTGEEGFTQWIGAVSRFAPAFSEKFTRSQSFLTGHILARDYMGMRGEQAYMFAKEFTQNTAYLYSTADRARLITGPVGSMFGLFKNWQMHYAGWLMEYTGEAFYRGNWKPLLWMLGGTSTVAGVGGLPLYHVADRFAEWATDESLTSRLFRQFGPENEDFSEAIYFGLPAFFGMSLQSTTAMPFSDPARDASMAASMVHWDRAQALGRAVGGAWDRWAATGQHPIHDVNTRDQFMRALAPKSFYRTAAVIEGDILKSLHTGYPQVKNLSPVDRLMYGLSINPTVVERTYIAREELWRDEERRRTRTRQFGEAWAQAEMAGDHRELTAIVNRALVLGLDLSNIIQSAKARMRQGQEDVIDRQFRPEEIWRKRHLLPGQGGF